MYSLFRRYQPRGRLLTVVYWLMVSVATVILLLIAFYWADKLMRNGGY